MYVLRYGRLGVFLRNEGTVHPLRRFYRILHAMYSRKFGVSANFVSFFQPATREEGILDFGCVKFGRLCLRYF